MLLKSVFCGSSVSVSGEETFRESITGLIKGLDSTNSDFKDRELNAMIERTWYTITVGRLTVMSIYDFGMSTYLGRPFNMEIR